MLWQIPIEVRRYFSVREDKHEWIFKCDTCGAIFTAPRVQGKLPPGKAKDAIEHINTHHPTESHSPPQASTLPPVDAAGSFANTYMVAVGRGYTNVARMDPTDKTEYGTVVESPNLSEHSTFVRAANRRHAAFLGNRVIADYIQRQAK